ncbi:NTP transferase domain-containing protein [Candidatus Micrarchaeota archaeon]|nr:NTP transferase domain-containing protein [Candidatus Micrarchaeota archaeon]
MRAVVMAAGDGKRMRPLTETRPKVMLPVAGRPMLEHLLLALKNAGIKEAVIIVRHLKEKITEYFKGKESELGMRLVFVEQGSETGTAAAILAAEKEISGTFVVVAGDIITDSENIARVMREHEGTITLAVKKVKNPHEYGIVEITGGKVSLFQEKPKNPKTELANLSIYCMEPSVFGEIRKLKKSERGEYEIVDLFLGAKAVEVDGYWQDVGYPWHLLDANAYLLSRMEARSGDISNSTIEGKVIMEKGAKIINSYIEGDVYIGKNSVIGPNAYIRGPVSIGSNCHLGGATTVKESILFDGVNAKHLSYLGDSIIGENVNFGSGTQIANFRFDEGVINVFTERGWVNTGRRKLGAIIGDEVKFGVLSSTMPGKMIGPRCWINSGVIVNANIPADSKVYARQELVFRKQEMQE